MNHEHLEKHIAKYDYIEGEKARKNFERVAKAVFQPTKTVVPAQPKKQASRRKSGKGGG